MRERERRDTGEKGATFRGKEIQGSVRQIEKEIGERENLEQRERERERRPGRRDEVRGENAERNQRE